MRVSHSRSTAHSPEPTGHQVEIIGASGDARTPSRNELWRWWLLASAAVLVGCSATTSGSPPPSATAAHTFTIRPVLSLQDLPDGRCAKPASTSSTGAISVCSYDGLRLYELGPAVVSGRDIASVKVTPMSPYFEVDVALRPSAHQAWAQATATAASKVSPQNQIAMVVDGIVVASPQVNGSITDGTLGMFQPTRAGADQLAERVTGAQAP